MSVMQQGLLALLHHEPDHLSSRRLPDHNTLRRKLFEGWFDLVAADEAKW